MTKRIIFIFCALIALAANKKALSQPIANFVIDSPYVFCNPVQVPFTNTSTGSGLQYSWSFGVIPGINSTDKDPIYYYFGCGNFNVTLTVTDRFGKTDSKTEQVVIHCTPFSQFGMGDSIICPGGKESFKDYSHFFNPTVTILWNFGDPTSPQDTSTLENPQHVFNDSGTYTVTQTLTSPYGCKASSYNTEIVKSGATVSAGSDVAICSNSFTQLLASGASSYSWQPSTGLSATNTANPVVHAFSTTTYTVIGTGSNGCTGSGQVVVTIAGAGTINAGPDQTVCIGSSAALNATGIKTFSWAPATGLSAVNVANPVASPVTTQSYVVSGQDTSSGCTVSDTVIVYVQPVPEASAPANITVCEGDLVDLIGGGGNMFSWSPQTSDLQNANSFHATASPSVNTTYTLIVSNGGSCTATTQVTVNVKPKPNFTAVQSVDYCPGSNVLLSASGAVSYAWSPATALDQTDIASPHATPAFPLTYTVAGTDANGCVVELQVQVNRKVPFDMVTNPGGTICLGEQLQLSASGALSYEWEPRTSLDNPFIPTPYASPVRDITYKVKGTDGCYFDSSYVAVKVNAAAPVKAIKDIQTFANNPVHLSAEGSGTFTWTPSYGLSCTDCQEPTATVQENTTYVVDLVNTDGCRSEDTVVVNVNCNSDLIFIPNAFTPNNDGKNDVFYIRTKGLKHLEVFKIYNRIGECIFETNSVENGWDGTFHGQKLPPGVFSYYAEAVCSQGEKVTFTGNVTLIR